MNPHSMIALFCEDIREESGNVATLVGLLPDNINVEEPPTAPGGLVNAPLGLGKFLNKLCVFFRANFDPDDPIDHIKLTLAFPNGEEVPIGEASSELIASAKREARAKALPLAGITMRIVVGGFKMQKGGGIVRMFAEVDGVKQILSLLNFQMAQETRSVAEN